ncbi:MAG TPA: alpha-L-arabinofuranosidase C-terminal domain-containing protein, partial [Lachnospiraceae bacterium]|nr:alpha-L-arabinofuranosidase C-terminal domain-containing protein [Lachnospiraceae bacterium]
GTSDAGALRAANGHAAPYKVDYFGVGNESWGGGGNMTAAYYADEYRRYQTYLKNYNKAVDMKLVAVGAPDDRKEWTEQVLCEAYKEAPADTHGFMDGLAVHYYTVPGTWEKKGSATDFTEDEWYGTMRKTMEMDRIIRLHGKIMDKYDPEKKIAMVIDEWGTWLDPEPGTNPAFLYQQNTMRDALVAGINLNLFNKNCDRVKMANIAQTINVLQAVILTDGKEMLLTPTYHAFDLYKVHQENTLLESSVEQSVIGTETDHVVNLTESVSEDENGTIYITITNQSLSEAYDIEAIFADYPVGEVHGRILTGEMNAHNTFSNKDHV